MRNKSIFRMVSLVLAAVIVLGGCTACGNSGASSAAGDKTASAQGEGAAASGKPVKLEIVRQGGPLPSADEDVILAAIEEKLNLDIEFLAYADVGDYINQINTRIATGSYPDLFWVNKELLNNYAKKGLILDLTSAYTKELKPVADYLGEDVMTLGMVDGKKYGIPNPVQFQYRLDFIREDWLKNLGLSEPATLEDYYNVALAFTKDDPDGNKKQDTFGITGLGLYAFSSIFGSYGVSIPQNSGSVPDIYIKDGQLVSSVTDPDVKDAILAAKRFVDAGVVDPELLGNSGIQVLQDKAFQGKVGIVRIEWSMFMKDEHAEQAKAANPEATWGPLHIPKNGSGKELNGIWQIGTAPHMFAIPSTAAADPAKLDAIYRLLNFVSEPEGNLLVQYGIEGTHFQMNGNQVEKINPDKWENIGHVWNYQFVGRTDEIGYLGIRFPNQKDVIKFAADEPRIKGLNGYVDFPDGFVSSDTATFAEEELIKFIYGRRPIEEYDAFVDTLMNLYNFKSYMEAAKTQLTELGLL